MTSAIPLECIPRKSRVLIVTLNAINQSHLKAVLKIAMKQHTTIMGIFSVMGKTKIIQETLEDLELGNKPPVTILIEKHV